MDALPLFYSSIAVLEREKDAELHVVDGGRDVAFAAKSHMIPALVEEIAPSCREIPTAFLNTGDKISLVFVVGTGTGRNAFIREGRWNGTYAPGYLRRYPFILGVSGEATLVCIDGSYVNPSGDKGERLFDENGSNTPYLDRAIAFANSYAQGAKITDEFCAQVKSYGLLKPVTIEIKPENGSSAVMHGLMTIDEIALHKLPDAAVVSLHRSGFLAAIHCHLVSISAFATIGERLSQNPISAPSQRKKTKSS